MHLHQQFHPVEQLLLVNLLMAREEMQRTYPQPRQHRREQPRNGAVAAMRHATGRALIALGSRLDPSARPALPAGDIATSGARG